jgi:hypothetical protein
VEQERVDFFGEFKDGHFFGDEIIGSGSQTTLAGFFATIGRVHEDTGIANVKAIANLAANLNAIHARHHNIEQNNIGHFILDGLESVTAVYCSTHSVSGILQYYAA